MMYPRAHEERLARVFDIILKAAERAKREQASQEVNRKGSWCPEAPSVFCQEGLCKSCRIYLRKENDDSTAH